MQSADRDERAPIGRGLAALAAAAPDELARRADRLLAEDAVYEVSRPVELLAGRAAVIEGFYRPLQAALSGLRRRDEILIGGVNRRAEGGRWIAALTHYLGNFTAPLFGIAPSGHVVFLRAGEFYRIEAGRVVLARIILDFPDLMHQAGRPAFPGALGTAMLFPGPASHDGVRPRRRARGAASLDLVEAMLGDLHAYDPASFDSAGQTGPAGYWAPDLLWHGPGGIGTSYRWEGFVKDHRAPFLAAFPDRRGGKHYCRLGDGDYAAVSGWPSMTMTHRGPYLGVPATGRALTLRVMDFYRCAGGRIAENWVLLDLVDLFAQMGVDLIARAGATGPAPAPRPSRAAPRR